MKKILITSLIIITSLLLYSFRENETKTLYGISIDNLIDTTIVKVTIYWGYKKSNITADGFKFRAHDGGKHKIIAVSRDLLKVYPLGSKVIVSGTGILDGIYTVKDKMAKRWTNKIDILVNKNYDLVSFKDIKLIKIDPGMEFIIPESES